MSRDYRLYLDDILESCQKIKAFTSGMTQEKFIADAKTIDAVVRNLEIIGEAVKNIPDEWLKLQPQIEWKKIARFRDIIVHHYFKVDLEVVWGIVSGSIGEVHEAVQLVLDKVEDTDSN